MSCVLKVQVCHNMLEILIYIFVHELILCLTVSDVFFLLVENVTHFVDICLIISSFSQ